MVVFILCKSILLLEANKGRPLRIGDSGEANGRIAESNSSICFAIPQSGIRGRPLSVLFQTITDNNKANAEQEIRKIVENSCKI